VDQHSIENPAQPDIPHVANVMLHTRIETFRQNCHLWRKVNGDTVKIGSQVG
jgi:hypothetical protein